MRNPVRRHVREGRARPSGRYSSAESAKAYDDKLLAGPFNQIARLTTRFSNAPAAAELTDEAEIAAHLQHVAKGPKQLARALVQALAAGSVAT
jgi:hypothetical protein